MRRVFLIASVTIFFLIIPFLIHADIYKWIDEKGTYHFTDDYSTIPERYRQQVEIRHIPEASKPVTEGETKGNKPLEIPLPSPAEQAAPLLFSGVIITTGTGAIVVTGGGKDMVFLVFEDTRIQTDDGKKVSFSELKNGKLVTVEYIEKGDGNHARSITINMGVPKATRVPDAVEDKPADPGQIQNPSDIQKGVWEEKNAHRLPDTRPKLPRQPNK